MNNENRREVDSFINAFDDLQLIRKKTNRNDWINEVIDRLGLMPQESIYRKMSLEKNDNEEVKEIKLIKRNTNTRIIDFLTASGFDNKAEDTRNLNRLPTSKIVKKNIAHELTNLYEFDQDDPDPFFELYDCQRMTFIESLLNKQVSSFIRVELKQNPNRIRPSLPFKIVENKEQKIKTYKNNSIEIEKALRPVYYDQEEIRTYDAYLSNGTNIIDKRINNKSNLSNENSDIGNCWYGQILLNSNKNIKTGIIKETTHLWFLR